MPSAKRSGKPAKKSRTPAKIITWSDLQRFSFANSRKLPRRVWANGELLEWVGIGWIPLDPDDAKGDEPTVVE